MRQEKEGGGAVRWGKMARFIVIHRIINTEKSSEPQAVPNPSPVS